MSSVLDQPSVETPSSPLETPYRFNAEDFFRMIELDVFPDDARVGLWEGQVYEEMAKKDAHSFSWSRLNTKLVRLLPEGWSVWAECSIAISPSMVPLPDLMILRGSTESYRGRRPAGIDAALIVELAESSLRIDTGAKLQGYAAAGIPVYWVVNLKDNLIHVYTDPIPSEGRYASATTVGLDGSIALVLDGNQVAIIATSDIL